MIEMNQPRDRYVRLSYVLLPILAISLFFFTRYQNSLGNFQPVFETFDPASHHEQTFEFPCRVSEDYELGFEFLEDLTITDFEKLIWLPSSQMPIEWTVKNNGVLVAQGNFKEFSFREMSLKKVRFIQKLTGLRNVIDLQRRIVRGVGKFKATAGESYEIKIRSGDIPVDISKAEPRFLVQRGRRIMERQVSKSAGLLVLCSFLLFLPIVIWCYRKIRMRVESNE